MKLGKSKETQCRYVRCARCSISKHFLTYLICLYDHACTLYYYNSFCECMCATCTSQVQQLLKQSMKYAPDLVIPTRIKSCNSGINQVFQCLKQYRSRGNFDKLLCTFHLALYYYVRITDARMDAYLINPISFLNKEGHNAIARAA